MQHDGHSAHSAAPFVTLQAIARGRPRREQAVFNKDLNLPDDLVGKEFRLTVRCLPTADREACSVFLGGTITGFELLADALHLHISTNRFAGRRVEYLDAKPAEWIGENDEWGLVCETPADTERAQHRFRCHLELLDRRTTNT